VNNCRVGWKRDKEFERRKHPWWCSEYHKAIQQEEDAKRREEMRRKEEAETEKEEETSGEETDDTMESQDTIRGDDVNDDDEDEGLGGFGGLLNMGKVLRFSSTV
jgi:hypothetical protein